LSLQQRTAEAEDSSAGEGCRPDRLCRGSAVSMQNVQRAHHLSGAPAVCGKTRFFQMGVCFLACPGFDIPRFPVYNKTISTAGKGAYI